MSREDLIGQDTALYEVPSVLGMSSMLACRGWVTTLEPVERCRNGARFGSESVRNNGRSVQPEPFARHMVPEYCISKLFETEAHPT
jgi:hypothetical protein